MHHPETDWGFHTPEINWTLLWARKARAGRVRVAMQGADLCPRPRT